MTPVLGYQPIVLLVTAGYFICKEQPEFWKWQLLNISYERTAIYILMGMLNLLVTKELKFFVYFHQLFRISNNSEFS